MHLGMKHIALHIALVSLCLLIRLRCTVLLRSGFPAPPHSYRTSDWRIHYFSPRPMSIEDTKQYQLSNPDPEWAALVPGNGTLYLGLPMLVPQVSLFHQLRCSDVIRREIVDALPQEMTRDCLNYLRHMVICDTDLTVQGRGFEAEVRAETKQCIKWGRVSRKLSELHHDL
ncbi:hypothetical protein EDB84DRAFT_520829 [Lactarius hengduanensis]|nr:hypothetical protein EDB84DRAFT_520829 [Lactarius hengduanensis]